MLDHLKLAHLICTYSAQQRELVDCEPVRIEYIALPPVTHYPYHLVASDGSQVYPDRHEGVSAYLVHTAAVIYDYKLRGSHFSVVTRPEVHSGIHSDGTPITAQEVDEQRTRAEYQLLTEHACQYALIDGNLQGDSAVLREKNILYAGYISKPRARDLVEQLHIGTSLCDAEVLESTLQPGYRTPFLYSHHARCYYSYLQLGREIARVEVPEYIAQHPVAQEALIRMVVDQCVKGDGYPLALAQAHEAAVVTAADRSFFYDMLRAQGLSVQRSLKLREKIREISS